MPTYLYRCDMLTWCK